MALYDEIAARLRRERELRKLSQQDLATELGVASNTVSRWETGTSKPRLEDLDRIAKSLGMGVGDLLPQNSIDGNEDLTRLVRTLEGLHADDLLEVERYAEFRRMCRAPKT